jgi:broad specificity phosphatase PhoE
MMAGRGRQRLVKSLCARRVGYGAAALAAPALLGLGSATAWADESITLDFVRHAETAANAAGIIDTRPPGDPLNAAGEVQAAQLANPDNPLHLAPPDSYAAIFASEETRAEYTALDWLNAAGAANTPVTQLPGLDEINAGIYEGQPMYSLDGILYLLAPMSWVFGNEFFPIPGSPDANGVAFDERFTQAVDAIYGNTPTDISSPTDVAFTSEGAMTVWTMMNVKNPDFPLLFTELLKTGQFVGNTDQIVVQGDPTDGWTLVSFDGTTVPANPGLPTELFVDARNLLEAPQFAAYNVYEAVVQGGDPATITTAIETGLQQVDAALMQFPALVVNDIVGELQDVSAAVAAGGSGEMSAIIADLVGSF